VRPVNDAPVMAALNDLVLNESEQLFVTVQASDADVGDQLAYSLDAAPAGASMNSGGRIEWTALDGPKDASFSVRVTDATGVSSIRSFNVYVANLPPQITATGPEVAHVGQIYTLALGYADLGTDAVSRWFVDWGDGTSVIVDGAQVNTTHVFTRAIEAIAVNVRGQDEDGMWSANSLRVRVLSDSTNSEFKTVQETTGPVAVWKDDADLREQPYGRHLYSFDAPDGFNVDYLSHFNAISSHPYSQALGFATIESGVSGTRYDGDQLAAIWDEESSPSTTAAGSTLQVRGVVITGGGLRIRFNQPIDVRALGVGDLDSRIVVTRDDVQIKGHVLVDPDGAGVTFVAETGLLPEGTYSIRLRSSAFKTSTGENLDGDYDGKPGVDYRGRFNIMAISADHFGLLETPNGYSTEAVGSFSWITERWGVQTDAWTETDALWSSLTGGIGGVAMLARQPRIFDTRLARRAMAAGARKLDNEHDEDAQKVRISSHAVKTTEKVLARHSPGWIPRWLGAKRTANQEWRVRL